MRQASAKRVIFPNDYWIVTAQEFRQHATVDEAFAERTRLRQERPDKEWRVVHCKRRIIKDSTSEAIIAGLRAEIAALKAELGADRSPDAERKMVAA